MLDVEKILPMKYPFITSYPYKANLLSVLLNYKDTIPWLLSQYIQLEFPQSYNFPRLDMFSLNNWKTCPWIYYQRIGRNIINSKWDSFTDFIIECISREIYVYVFLNMDAFGYVSKHDKFIYGYNTEEQVFFVADFYLHTGFSYAYDKISFSEMEKAYQSTLDEDDWLSGIELINYRTIKNDFFRKSRINYEFDIKTIKMSLEEYLNSINSSIVIRNSNEQFKKNFVFGMDIYKQLEKYMNEASKNKHIDIRPFHVLYDHKKYMLYLVYYLYNNHYISNVEKIYSSYYKMTQDALKLRNLIIKYDIKPSENILKIAYDLLNIICSEEKKTVTSLIRALEMKDDNDNNAIYGSDDKNEVVSLDVSIFDERILYSDKWYANFEYIGKIIISTNQPDEFLLYGFSGTAISCFAPKNNRSGYIDIYLDGIKKEVIDLYCYDSKETKLVFHIENLSQGYHMLKVICTGNKNPDSADCGISIEKLRIQKHKEKAKIGNIATFIKIDRNSKGSWKNDYGRKGYEIFGTKKILPDYLNYSFINAKQYIWYTNITDNRALQNPNSFEYGTASCMYNDKFTIDLIITGSKQRSVSFYFCDFDRFGRTMQVEITDYDTQQLLYKYDVNDYTEGIYLRYYIKGRVLVTFICTGGPNAILSGIFFD